MLLKHWCIYSDKASIHIRYKNNIQYSVIHSSTVTITNRSYSQTGIKSSKTRNERHHHHHQYSKPIKFNSSFEKSNGWNSICTNKTKRTFQRLRQKNTKTRLKGVSSTRQEHDWMDEALTDSNTRGPTTISLYANFTARTTTMIMIMTAMTTPRIIIIFTFCQKYFFFNFVDVVSN